MYAVNAVRNGWEHLPAEQTGKPVTYHSHSNNQQAEIAVNSC
jgi:hypothetical protein